MDKIDNKELCDMLMVAALKLNNCDISSLSEFQKEKIKRGCSQIINDSDSSCSIEDLAPVAAGLLKLIIQYQ